MEREDGEMSDDNAMLVDEGPLEKVPVADEDCTVLFKAEKDGLVIKQLEKVDAAKLEERAKRFGLNLSGNRVITQTQIDELYTNFGIESGNERHFRFDAIYLNGVDGLTTREIFEYLEDYKPSSLEWIDDMSCNIVCQDHISAALALLLHSREIKSQELKDMLSEKSRHHWREGMPHPKKELILMRFATNGKKKKLIKKLDTKYKDDYYDQTMDSVSKNPWGDLCQSWGVYDHQEIFRRTLPKGDDYEDDIEEEPRPAPIQIRNKKLAMRLGKRKVDLDNSSDDSSSDSEWKSKSKTPRMRMHADDEECKLKKKRVNAINSDTEVNQIQAEKYAPLSIEIVNSGKDYNIKSESTRVSDKFKFHGEKKQNNTEQLRSNSVRSRLGGKVTKLPEDNSSKSGESSDESSEERYDINITSKVQKVSTELTESSVWSRLESKQNNAGGKSDLRQMLKSKTKTTTKTNKNKDLRSRLGKSKHANLRIEIDNHSTSK